MLRRLVTVPSYLAATAFATSLTPVLAPLCALVSMPRSTRGTLRSFAFVVVYLWCETIGVAVSAWLWLRHGFATPPREQRWRRFLDANFALQCWWANSLKVAAERLFDLRFVVSGTDALDGQPAIMLLRHASIADTVIPMVFYAIPRRVRLRYVLKRELLLDPCLDIVGNRLPNCFVARSGVDADGDIERVSQLARGLGPDEGLLLYPEGTRFSAARRRRVLERLAPNVGTAELERMHQWTDLLPPRPGGTCAALTASPGRDVIFCAHTGFEGASHFSTLLNGSWIGAVIRIHFWRVDHREIPVDWTAQRDWLFAQWDRMQQTIALLRTEAADAVA